MAHIDWITATIPYHWFDLEKLPLNKAFSIATSAYPPKRYQTAWYLENGALLAIPSHANARQKVLFQMTGDSLEMNRALEIDDLKLLRWLFAEAKARFPRLDVAFDTKDSYSNPDHLLWAYEGGIAKTRIKAPVRSVRNSEGGVTHYFGAADSDRIMRVYDKAKELQLLSEVLTRVELQNRNAQAQHLVSQMVNNNELDWTAAAAVKGLIDFPTVAWFQNLMKSGGVKLEPLGRKQTDWQRYIQKIIEPSFINHYREDDNGDRMFIRQSLQRIQEKIKSIDDMMKGR